MNRYNIIRRPSMILLLYVAGSYAIVEQGRKQINTVSVECRSNADIKFQIVRETVNKTRETIANCETTTQSCYLKHQSLGRFYAVYYTGEGAMLSVVLDVEETRGTYYCCETFNFNNCIELDVSLPVNITPKTKSTEESSSDIAIIRTCSIILCVQVMMGLLVYSIKNITTDCIKEKFRRGQYVKCTLKTGQLGTLELVEVSETTKPAGNNSLNLTFVSFTVVCGAVGASFDIAEYGTITTAMNNAEKDREMWYEMIDDNNEFS